MIDYSHYPSLVERADLAGNGENFTDTQVKQACEDVRGACGWHISPQYEDTFHLDSDGQTVLTLPTLLMGEPTSVTEQDGTPITDYQWTELGQLTRAQGWPKGFRAVVVTVEHGLPTVPASIVGVIQHMLEERAGAIPGRGPLKSVSHDGASFSFGGDDRIGVQADPLVQYGHVLHRFQVR